MPDTGYPNDRLAELEERWEDDKSPRVFLPLSEEHRRRGEPEKALEILEKGLAENPQHLSGEIARAKLLLELDRWPEAIEILDAVMVRDATHLVAAKLLVEAQLQRGDAIHARRRLDLYRSLNPSDPEIEPLDERIRDLQLADAAPPQSEPAIVPIDPLAAIGFTMEDDSEESAGVGSERSAAAAPEPETVPEPAPGPEPEIALEPEADSAFESAPPAPAEPEPVPAAAPAGMTSFAPRDNLEDPFSYLGRPEDEGRYLLGLGREQIFPVVLPPAQEEPAPPEPEPEPETAGKPEEETASEAVELESAAGDDGAPPEPETEPEAAADFEPDAGPAGGESEAPATVTLGALYLRQGHHDEAERIFHRVLEREPDSIAARDGLRAVRDARSKAAPEPEPAPEPVRVPEATSAPEPASAPEVEAAPPAAEAAEPGAPPSRGEPLTARDLLGEEPADADAEHLRIELLKRYRTRLRRTGESESHVP